MSEPKKVETWMPMLVDKYLGDTTHLSTEQHGAYLLLLFSMWKKGGVLPDDEKQLANISKLTPLKWRNHRTVLLAFFRSEDGGLTQKRLSQELTRAIANVQQKSVAGKASAEAKKARKKANARSTDVATGVATDKLTKKQRPAKPRPIPPSLPSREGSGAVAPVPMAGRTVATWDAYAEAFEVRYGTAPIRNRRMNSLLAQFVELVPMDEAPRIAAHFVQSDGNLYIAASHALNLLVRDAEKLRMEWKTGRRSNSSQASGKSASKARMYAEHTGAALVDKANVIEMEPTHARIAGD